MYVHTCVEGHVALTAVFTALSPSPRRNEQTRARSNLHTTPWPSAEKCYVHDAYMRMHARICTHAYAHTHVCTHVNYSTHAGPNVHTHTNIRE